MQFMWPRPIYSRMSASFLTHVERVKGVYWGSTRQDTLRWPAKSEGYQVYYNYPTLIPELRVHK